jgi:hypothetical protein
MMDPPCPDGEIQNLDLTSCMCEPMGGEGIIIDANAIMQSTTMMHHVFRFNMSEFFTVREWATTNADSSSVFKLQ